MGKGSPGKGAPPNALQVRAFLLGCGCSNRYRKPWPGLGDDIYCLKHGATYVSRRSGADYDVRCYGCRYSRTFGADKLGAERAAATHHRKHPDHHTCLYNTGILHWELKPQRLVALPLPIPGDPDVPPF